MLIRTIVKNSVEKNKLQKMSCFIYINSFNINGKSIKH